MKYLTAILLLLAFTLPACANSPTDKSIDDKASLQITVQTFHKHMRWRNWESASMLVAPENRQEFLGRYDELGEDYHISNLELKSLSRVSADKAVLDVEEESYKEPAMIVKKKRLIEIWEKRDSDWILAERLPKDDYKERKKAETKAAEKAAQEKADQEDPATEQPATP
jgi:hypothetical protein